MRQEVLKTALFTVCIKSPAYSVECGNVDYDTAQGFLKQAFAANEHDTVMLKHLDTAQQYFGFGGSGSALDFKAHIDAYLPKVPTGEKLLCPRRAEGGPVHQSPEALPDEWIKVGADRTCSYCGSVHPDRLLELIREAGFGIVERSDKSYKWYLRRADVPNARFGAIKYYRQHDTPAFVAAYNGLLTLTPGPSVVTIPAPKNVVIVSTLGGSSATF